MKVCIIGAGAIGGFIGTRLAAAGQCELSAIARGATLDALRTHGWRLREAGQAKTGQGPSAPVPGVISAPAHATDDPASLGVQDLVIVAVKAQAMPAVAAAIAPLLGPQTMVMPAMNGVPWWFGAAVPALAGAPLRSVDPDGSIAAAIPLQQVIGCVVHASAASPAPGLVEHRMGQGLIVGEAAGGQSGRVHAVAQLLGGAGFEVSQSADIRKDIWYKLWGNLTMNPVSAMTGATADRILGDPLVRAFCSAAMQEASDLGALVGCAIEQSPEARQQVTAKLGAFKTSMLQDAEAGRPIELDAIVTVVHEMAGRLGLATPNIDALLGLARLFARTHGLYPQAVLSTVTE
jgi:2-dehydropantoate 2-reductase